MAALRNGFAYGKLFHQLEEIVSELLRYLWEIPSDAHQSFSCQELRWEMRHFVVSRDVLSNGTTLVTRPLNSYYTLLVTAVAVRWTFRWGHWITATVAGA